MPRLSMMMLERSTTWILILALLCYLLASRRTPRGWKYIISTMLIVVIFRSYYEPISVEDLHRQLDQCAHNVRKYQDDAFLHVQDFHQCQHEADDLRATNTALHARYEGLYVKGGMGRKLRIAERRLRKCRLDYSVLVKKSWNDLMALQAGLDECTAECDATAINSPNKRTVA